MKNRIHQKVLRRIYLNACIGLAVLVSLSAVGTTWAQPEARMGISPDRYQVTFDERGGETQALLIQNMSDEPLTVFLTVSNWDLDDDNQIREIPPTESSLDQWIVINPLRITIPPNSPQTFRWAIMPRLQPEQGEYRAIIFLEEELAPQVEGEGTQLRMKMRYGLPIYAQVGKRIQSAQLHQVSANRIGTRIDLELTNTGNSHGRMSGNYGVWPAAEFPGTERALSLLRSSLNQPGKETNFDVRPMPGAVILPENRRTIPVNLTLTSPGDYVVQLNAEFADLDIRDTIAVSRPGG